MNLSDLIAQSAQAHGVPAPLLHSLVQTESNGNPNAVGPLTYNGQHAQGLGQLLPTTAKSLGVDNPFDPQQNLNGAASLLQENYKRYGNWSDAVNAYHGGTDKANWGPKTQAYNQKVLAGAGMWEQPQGQAGQAGQPQTPVDPLDAALAQRMKQPSEAAAAQTSTSAPAINDPLQAALSARLKQPDQQTAQQQTVQAPTQQSPSILDQIKSAVGTFGQAAMSPLHNFANTVIEQPIAKAASAIAPGSALANYLQKTAAADIQAAETVTPKPVGLAQHFAAVAGGLLPYTSMGAGGVLGDIISGATSAALPFVGKTFAPLVGSAVGNGVAGLGAQSSGNSDTAKNVAVSAALGAAMPVAFSGVSKLATGLKNIGSDVKLPFSQDAKTSSTAKALMADPTMADALERMQAYKNPIPGYTPTAAEVGQHAALTANLAANKADPAFQALQDNNRAALVSHLDSAMPTAAELAAGEAQKAALIKNAKSSFWAQNIGTGKLVKDLNAMSVPVDDQAGMAKFMTALQAESDNPRTGGGVGKVSGDWLDSARRSASSMFPSSTLGKNIADRLTTSLGGDAYRTRFVEPYAKASIAQNTQNFIDQAKGIVVPTTQTANDAAGNPQLKFNAINNLLTKVNNSKYEVNPTFVKHLTEVRDALQGQNLSMSSATAGRQILPSPESALGRTFLGPHFSGPTPTGKAMAAALGAVAGHFGAEGVPGGLGDIAGAVAAYHSAGKPAAALAGQLTKQQLNLNLNLPAMQKALEQAQQARFSKAP